MPAIAPHKTAISEAAWDGPANEARLRSGETEAYYHRAYAWQDPAGDPKTKAAYKFIHHEVDGRGNPGAANVSACRMAIAVLNGARGGTTIPRDDRPGVYRHAAGHLKDAGLEVPPLSGEDGMPELEALELSTHGISHVLHAVERTPWVILPHKLDEILALLELRMTGGRLSVAEIRARVGNPQRPAPQIVGRVGILPVNGVLVPKANLFTEISGGMSMQALSSEFRALARDPGVEGIVLDVDSPGGAVTGVEELAQEIFAARGQKPVWAVADHLAASGAYWLASQANRLYATPTGDVGSIGVLLVHTDRSKAEEARGIKTSYISAGRYKTLGNETEPLSDEGRAVMQQFVDEAYDMFVEAVARGRGSTAADVRAGYGEGQIVHAARARRMGMIDGIATLEQVVGQMQQEFGSAGTGRGRAAAYTPSEEPLAAAAVPGTGALRRLRLRNENAKRRS